MSTSHAARSSLSPSVTPVARGASLRSTQLLTPVRGRCISNVHPFAPSETKRHTVRMLGHRSHSAHRNAKRLSKVRCLVADDADPLVQEAATVAPPGDAWEADMLSYVAPDGVARVQAPPGAAPVVLLPGFGNCTTDYTEPFGNQAASIAAQLRSRGFEVYVPELLRKDWFKVARAIFTRGFWTGNCGVDPGYTWYLDRVHDTVQLALQETGATQVNLLGHSAGGWLGRAYMGQPRYYPEGSPEEASDGHPSVRTLVTLGSPHVEPPEGVPDMTRGVLKSVNQGYPGAYYSTVQYACITGRTVRGNAAAEPKTLPKYAFNAYSQTCGDGDQVCGDGVVPNRIALLEGAENVVIHGVFHSMSQIGTFETESKFVWYGSDTVVDLWADFLR